MVVCSCRAVTDRAVRAAREAFDHGEWGPKTATERGRILMRVGQAFLDHHQELAEIEADVRSVLERQGILSRA